MKRIGVFPIKPDNHSKLLKTSYAPSWGLWIPLVWLLLSISKSVSFWLHPVSSAELNTVDTIDVAGSFVDRSVLIGLMTLGLIILVRRRIEWSNLLRSNRILVTLFIYMGQDRAP